jgi:asparagine synthase (glutamine-hydrolysing)
MRGVFLFLMRPSGNPVTREIRRRFEASARRSDLPMLRWTIVGDIACALGPDAAGLGTGPILARTPGLVVVGNARLDNRDEVARWAEAPGRLAGANDVEVVAAAVDARGAGCIPEIVGDFALVLWDPSRRELKAARDAFGVKALYYTGTGADLVAFASRASVLADSGAYDSEYIADYLAEGLTRPERSVFDGVLAVPAATILSLSHGITRSERYWSAASFRIDERLARHPEEQSAKFRSLFAEAVRLRLTGRDDTWAQLSGGLDSSSIVAMAQQLQKTGQAPAGVGGTVTIVDTLSGSDERAYAEEVVGAFGLHNERVIDYWMWQDDGRPPPLTEAPNPQYPFFAQDRRMCELVRNGGGRALLSGLGSDHYLWGNYLFFADWAAKGEIRKATRELARWATLGRTSFWRFAFDNAAVPLLTPRMQRMLNRGKFAVPPWVDRTFAKQLNMRDRSLAIRAVHGSAARRYEHRVARAVDTLGFGYDSLNFTSQFDVRYPFLHRPLVEFALQLPVELRTRPYERKWVLREAMRGILPEAIRRRPGKAGIAGRMVWSLRRERETVQVLLNDPLIARHGWVDPIRLRSGVEAALGGNGALRGAVIRSLALETWMRVRSGWWPARQYSAAVPVSNPAHNLVNVV